MSPSGTAGAGRGSRLALAGGLCVGVAVGIGVGGGFPSAPPPTLEASPLWAVPAPLHFPDGPPARLTGGFGEDSCFACHWNGTENDDRGALRLTGFPERYEPGARYMLTVELERPGLVVGGFQLAVRHPSDTTQAGVLEVPDEESARVALIEERGITFAQHRLDGIQPTGEEAIRWKLLWTAPSCGEPVLLHVSAVAGDGDQSQIGDHVYTREIESRAACP